MTNLDKGDTGDESNPVLALLRAVRELTTTAEANARELRELRRQQVREARKSFWTRVLAVANLVGLAMDVLLTVFAMFAIAALVHFKHAQEQVNARQDCAAQRTEAFLSAEHAKVSGQIGGKRMELAAVEQIVAGQVRLGLTHFEQGSAQFVAASQHYLDKIDHLSKLYRC